NIPAIEYLFNEEGTPLPDLGGIQKTIGKRHRHRRALMRMLFDYFETDRLIICLDPDALDLLRDFCGDRSTTRLLEVEVNFSEDYLKGHAMRIGLAGDQTPKETLERLLPTIRHDLTFESDQIRDANFGNHDYLRESDGRDAHARAVSQFLAIPESTAHDIVNIDYLFTD
ncbi:MAG: DUF5928 domain-containing protein, partial [Pseudomonadota bacterium]|nr:DUF5928 domain-containing protein [Pseudomonadota bacterium]